MTVVAWDGISIAADRQGGGSSRFACAKLFPQLDGRVIAGAGVFVMVNSLVKWIAAGADPLDYPAQPPGLDLEASVLEVAPSGRATVYEAGCTSGFNLLPGHAYALGSGRDFALAAMHLG